MFPDQLMSLLEQGDLVPDTVPGLVSLSHNWFIADPGLTQFVLRAIFSELAHRWDDPQGVPMPAYAPFHDRLLPQLNEFVGHSVGTEEEPGALARLVQVFRDCCVEADRGQAD
jgi:hypothetical protein